FDQARPHIPNQHERPLSELLGKLLSWWALVLPTSRKNAEDVPYQNVTLIPFKERYLSHE
ncbi:hypothetical protein, partial [Pseudomonas brassicae]|uniref:hypothetical protein n=1 Tax=Pseudomonas brassicae TaxID=2708063 RepID=UPI001FB5432E